MQLGVERRFLGSAALIGCLQGALVRGLHLLQADTFSHAGALAGFVLALLHVLHRNSHILWITRSSGNADCGAIYGPGLLEGGVDPARILIVEASRANDVLWAVEEGLRSKAVGAVVGEIATNVAVLDLTATRRLALRSNAAQVPAYLSVVAREVGATAARTRWRIASLPSRPARGPQLLGEPTWTLDLLKNRAGPCGRGAIGFSPSRGAFYPLAADDGARAGRVRFDRSSDPVSPVAPLVVPFNAAVRHKDAGAGR